MTSFTWLHLTDLHIGQDDDKLLRWNDVRKTFFTDLENMITKVKPLDAVFFTGDLTQRGTKDNFRNLSRELELIRDKLDKLGSHPILLVVPGNHDLERPSEAEARILREAVFDDALGELRDEKWENPSWKEIKRRFTEFERWWKKYREKWWMPYQKTGGAYVAHEGMLPGDFKVTIQKEDATLGVMGLNSAFLQLAGGDFYGKLALGIQQANMACKTNKASLTDWVYSHDICLLMTHHPAEWLSPESRRTFHQSIYAPGHFALHLFGHMHEQDCSFRSDAGSAMRQFWQGSALYGSDFINGAKVAKRTHGYSFGQVQVPTGRKEGVLRFWPRRFNDEKHLHFASDPALMLDLSGEHTLGHKIKINPREPQARAWLVSPEEVSRRLKTLGLSVADKTFWLPRELTIRQHLPTRSETTELIPPEGGGGNYGVDVIAEAIQRTNVLRHGSHGILLLAGEPGVGKTTLIMRYIASQAPGKQQILFFECVTGTGHLLLDFAAKSSINELLQNLDKKRDVLLGVAPVVWTEFRG